MTPIHVVLAADATFVRPLAACLSSLIATHESGAVRVSIMTDSISSSDRTMLSDLIEIEWLDVDPRALDGAQMPGFLPLASAWRLLIADLLAATDHRVLYLDADTLVRASLLPLWETELGGDLAAAVRDPVVPWFGAPHGPPWRELNIAPDAPYFNAGVLLIDVDAWREQEVGRKAFDLLRRSPLPFGDQCALNTVLAGRWKRLPASWNLQAEHLVRSNSFAWVVEPSDEMERAMSDPRVVHFNTSAFGRPWLPGCSHPFRDEWHALLASTPWASQPLAAPIIPDSAPAASREPIEPTSEMQELIERGLSDVLPFQPGIGTMLQKQFMADTRRHPPRDQAEFIDRLRDADASWFSQNGEDGIVLYLLSLMNGLKRLSVEIGAGDGIENNTTNLIVHHGYRGLLVDPSWAIEWVGREFFRRVHTTREHPPTIVNDFVEVDNIAAVVANASLEGEIDVLSIDVCGNDFWLAQALVNVRPKILVVPLNLQVGPDACVSMQYEPRFAYFDGPQTGYLGASLRAYDALARKRGLVFAGCDRTRINGFWVQRGSIPVVEDGVPLDFVWTEERGAGAIAYQDVLLSSWPWVDVSE